MLSVLINQNSIKAVDLWGNIIDFRNNLKVCAVLSYSQVEPKLYLPFRTAPIYGSKKGLAMVLKKAWCPKKVGFVSHAFVHSHSKYLLSAFCQALH